MIEQSSALFWFLYRHPFIRYLVVGGTTFMIDLGLLILLHGHFRINLTIATTVGYWVSVTYNFFLNRHWVFSAQQAKRLHEHAFLYGCLLGINYIYTVVAMNVLTKHISYEFAKMIVIVVAIAWTYPIYKRYIFYVSNTEQNAEEINEQ
jgi:putative flippase GtrA